MLLFGFISFIGLMYILLDIIASVCVIYYIYYKLRQEKQIKHKNILNERKD